MSKVDVSHVVWMALLVASCSRAKEVSPKRTTDAWRRGDIAVVEPSAADFFEAQVLEATAGHLKVQRSKGGESLQVGMGDAYRIPQVATNLANNAWAICQLKAHEWSACRVLRREAPQAVDAGKSYGVTVSDALGNEHTLSTVGDVIEPSGLTAMNVQRRFEQFTRRVNFEKSFRDAGKLRRSPGWQPAPRRLVLASRDGQWFGAQVVEVDDERVVVRWDGQTGVTDLAKDDVGPQPPACGTVGRGDRALRRPPGHGAAWMPVAVLGVDGAEAVTEDVERVRVSVQTRDLCAFGQPPTSPNK